MTRRLKGSVAKTGSTEAKQGTQQVLKHEQMLQGIAGAVGNIASTSEQMSLAIHQQLQGAEEIKLQVVNISKKAAINLEKSAEVSEGINLLKGVATDLHETVVRFKR